jgi:hypothetical protein
VRRLIEEAVAREREACAALAEELGRRATGATIPGGGGAGGAVPDGRGDCEGDPGQGQEVSRGIGGQSFSFPKKKSYASRGHEERKLRLKRNFTLTGLPCEHQRTPSHERSVRRRDPF